MAVNLKPFTHKTTGRERNGEIGTEEFSIDAAAVFEAPCLFWGGYSRDKYIPGFTLVGQGAARNIPDDLSSTDDLSDEEPQHDNRSGRYRLRRPYRHRKRPIAIGLFDPRF
ncbi:hypothetical protein [[Phormidium] sp. ETS-05]|uniref:hypothetical protein n=1 Tax=[Phormidium] sp. ETS-05 TaxID=222819 RepID=UPI0018EF1AED|nr:hypothetical protein [[Phormidium] sp. ETS-05]